MTAVQIGWLLVGAFLAGFAFGLAVENNKDRWW